MTRRATTLDELPLYADDLAIGVAVLGPGRGSEWVSLVPLLEAKGLPKIDTLHGGRCVPSVKQFYESYNGISRAVPTAPRGVEKPIQWTKNARKYPA